jgi:2-polyprenyl-3-methyl-5-hydroxy-6-metoxy-1,4-benzoquinol methylase
MPTSGWHKIGHVMRILRFMPQPESVLDVGIGFGKFGFLLRENLDIRKRRYNPSEWKTKIDGVEVWEKYITPAHRYVYDSILVGDIRQLVSTLGKYDLIVLADVIEHMTFEEGAQLLRTLFQEHCSGGMVVSYPNCIGSDWKNWENPHEKHHCIWHDYELDQLFPDADVQLSTPQVCYILRRG